MDLRTRINANLSKRKLDGTYRSLTQKNHLIDFCSNDYLGVSRNTHLHHEIAEKVSQCDTLGATGSRLISGNNKYVENLEDQLARFFNAESALLFNSGYTANLAIISTLCRKNDVIIYDELIHASLHDGLKLSKAQNCFFKHNDIEDLILKLEIWKDQLRSEGQIFILIESLYSMDGDLCPLDKIIEISEAYNANIIIDEAHSTGIYGSGAGLVAELNVEEKVFARIHTFGKAIGFHGAVIVGDSLLKDYLINFAKPFIYTTAPPLHSIVSLTCIFNYLASIELRSVLNEKIAYFRSKTSDLENYFLKSNSPIQSFVLSGNDRVKYLAYQLEKEAGIYVKAIVSPTVPKGKERLRICIHSFNTYKEIDLLTYVLNQALKSYQL